MNANILRMPPQERADACRKLQEHPSGPLELSDHDECAEYRQAVCHFPDWLGYPYEVDEERLNPER